MKLFKIANEYIKQSDWKTLSAIKFCLASIGIIIGMYVPENAKNIVLIACFAVFLVTYIPLMKKLFDVYRGSKK